MELDLCAYGMLPYDCEEVEKTHLFINLDRAEHCLELSFQYRLEKLRRMFAEKYLTNRSEFFEWIPDDTISGILGCDLSEYMWQYGDPGIWLAGKHLSHRKAIPAAEQQMPHVPFRSKQELEI